MLNIDQLQKRSRDDYRMLAALCGDSFRNQLDPWLTLIEALAQSHCNHPSEAALGLLATLYAAGQLDSMAASWLLAAVYQRADDELLGLQLIEDAVKGEGATA